jgi:hypothetical protein
MTKLTEFEYGKLPEVLYHGTGADLRENIAKNGLTQGYVTKYPELAAEYAGPDIYEVTKHPNIISEGGWDPKETAYAQGIPATHVKRVGHAIWHQEEIGGHRENEIHWHPAEECHHDFDVTWAKNDPGSVTDFTNVRPHPTNPDLMVGSYFNR